MSRLAPARPACAVHRDAAAPSHGRGVFGTLLGRLSLHDRARGERGSSQVFLILTVVTLIVVIGLVVDGGARVQAATHAQHVAASAARAATNAVSGQTVGGDTLAVDPALAQQVAIDYIAEAGMTGTVTASGAEITVSVEHAVDTMFLSLIGITSLRVTGEARAILIDGPDGLGSA